MNDKTLLLLRNKIDSIDREILLQLGKRFVIGKKIGALKKKQKLSIVSISREQEVLKKIGKHANDLGVNQTFAKRLFRMIIKETKNHEK